MTFLDRLAPPAPPARKADDADFEWDDQRGWTVVTGSTGDAPRTFEHFVEHGFRDNAAVSACVREIRNSFTEAPLLAFFPDRDPRTGKDGWRRAVGHRLEGLLESPTDRDPALALLGRSIQHLLLGGNWFWRLLRSGSGTVEGIRPILPTRVVSVITNDAIPIAYRIMRRGSGAWDTIPASEIVHVPDFDPIEEVFGLPRLLAAKRPILTERRGDDYVTEILHNHGTPGLIVGTDKGVSADAIERAEELWAEKYGAGTGRGKIAFAPGASTIREIGFNLSDLEFPDLRRIAGERICAVMGVDPMLIGIGSASRGSTLSGTEHAEARAKLWDQTIIPLYRHAEAYLNVQLSPYFGEVRLFFDTTEVAALQDDRNKDAERAKTMAQAGVYTLQEIRIDTNYDPDPRDGEPLVGPLNLMVGRDEDDGTDGGDGGTEGDEGDGDDGETSGRGASARKIDLPDLDLLFLVGDPSDGKQRRRAWKAFDGFARAAEPVFRDTAASLFTEWEDRLASVTSATLEEQTLSRRSRFGAIITKQLTPESVRAWQRRMRLEKTKYHRAWRERFEALTSSTVEMVGGQVATQLGVSFDLFGGNVQQFITDRPNLLAGNVADSTFNAIKASIEEGMAAGESTATLAHRVEDVFGQGYSRGGVQLLSAAQRARLIARTESTAVTNGGAWASARDTGLDLDKEWLTQGDDRVRDEHALMEGESVKMDEAFSNGSDYPDEPNCRCTMLFHVKR